jgi:chromosome segregation ATPase
MSQLRALEQRTQADVAVHDAHLKECRAREAEYQRLGLAHDATQRRANDQRTEAAAEARNARRERERLSDELREEKRHAADLDSQHAWVTRRFEELKARYDSERSGRWARTAQALEERERELAAVRASLTRLQRQADDCARRHQHEAAELKRLLDQHHQRGSSPFSFCLFLFI